jgi:ribosomal protein S1
MSSVSFASEKKTTPTNTGEKKTAAKAKQMTGEVNEVDTKTMTLSVSKKIKGNTQVTMFSVNDRTKIMLADSTKSLADIKVGDKVKVKYTNADGKNIAKSISIKSSEKKT